MSLHTPISASTVTPDNKSNLTRQSRTEEKKSTASSRFSKSTVPASKKTTASNASKEDLKNRRFWRKLSPLAEDPEHYEARLPNNNTNYSHSPAARLALRDGSLDPHATYFNRTFNRKLKMRDTFTKIFPGYTHGTPSVAMASTT